MVESERGSIRSMVRNTIAVEEIDMTIGWKIGADKPEVIKEKNYKPLLGRCSNSELKAL